MRFECQVGQVAEAPFEEGDWKEITVCRLYMTQLGLGASL